MNVWTPIGLILLLTYLAGAIGIRVILLGCASLVASYVCFVASSGGFSASASDESRAMAYGFGLMFMMPVAVATLVALALARWTYRYLAKHDFKPLEAIGPSPVAASQADAVRIALSEFRRGSSVRIRCAACRRGLAARRVLSANNVVPDIEVACPCGACTGVHPFNPES